MNPNLHVSGLAELPSATLYEILRLRIDVFVVEQRAAYPDIDGRDAEPGALLVWADDDEGVVLSTARILREPGAMRIGRVATAPAARGQGVAGAIMRYSVALCGDAAIHLDAQAHLVDWYARFGFAVAGERYLEDDIPHYPMLRPAAAS